MSTEEPANARSWRRLELPRIAHEYGDLCFGEGGRHIPFEIRRIFYVFDIPAFAVRGTHAHRSISQVIFAVKGGFSAVLANGKRSETVRLSRPEEGLLIGPMVWKSFENYEPDTICLIAASGLYDQDEYIRDHEEYKALLSRSSS